MILSFESVQQILCVSFAIFMAYCVKHSFGNTYFTRLRDDGFSLVMFGAKASDFKLFCKNFIKRVKEKRQIVYYWSSTTNHSNHNNAWIVNFGYGNTNNNNKNNSNYVRCVRAG